MPVHCPPHGPYRMDESSRLVQASRCDLSLSAAFGAGNKLSAMLCLLTCRHDDVLPQKNPRTVRSDHLAGIHISQLGLYCRPFGLEVLLYTANLHCIFFLAGPACGPQAEALMLRTRRTSTTAHYRRSLSLISDKVVPNAWGRMNGRIDDRR